MTLVWRGSVNSTDDDLTEAPYQRARIRLAQDLRPGDNSDAIRKDKVHSQAKILTVLDCPTGKFQGAGVKTVVLFFERGAPTRRVWFYQLARGRNLGKTNPLNDDDLQDFVELQKTFVDSPKSWSGDVTTVDRTTFGLSVKNSNGGEVVTHRGPQEILDEVAALDAESVEVLQNIRALPV